MVGLGFDVNEDEGVVAMENMVDGPFHRLLAVLVFVDGHHRRRRRTPVIVALTAEHFRTCSRR